MELPGRFTARMQNMLGDEYEQFIESYEKEKAQALRANTLKIEPEELKNLAPFTLKPVPWVREGFYYGGQDRPGKHPYHEMGLYYIQEPSAMAVAALAGVEPGERILDLCAAPGGKSTQLAAALQGKGFLMANEIHPARAKILAQNIERMGIKNCMVTNETPQHLSEQFQGFFDRIVVDAPCSGEGMFKKEEQALVHWSQENVDLCAARQKEILDAAVTMLRPGGTLVYSTCTFAPEENEGSVKYLLTQYPEFHVKKVKAYEGFAPGQPSFAEAPKEVKDTFRLWPHRLDGEGHYVAILEREGQALPADPSGKIKAIDKNVEKLYREFEQENLRVELSGEKVLFGEQLYLMPLQVPMKGLKILRAGLHLGTVLKNRFEPSHALALALKKSEVVRSVDLCAADSQVTGYLKGNTVTCEGEKGWNLLCVDGYPIGWGKYNNGVLKNHYPKGLRWM